MDVTDDEIAAIADLFGGLTRGELTAALAELAYKAGEAYDPDEFETAVERAIQSYALVRVVPEGITVGAPDEPIFVPGPVAFPDLPPEAPDLVHIMDVEERSVDNEAASIAAAETFREDLVEAIDADNEARLQVLTDVSYEIETWAAVDLTAEREQLDSAR